jgi:hypothetical protein
MRADACRVAFTQGPTWQGRQVTLARWRDLHATTSWPAPASAFGSKRESTFEPDARSSS